MDEEFEVAPLGIETKQFYQVLQKKEQFEVAHLVIETVLPLVQKRA